VLHHIFKFGTEEQKKKYLVRLASGKADWRVVADRAGGGFGRGRHANDCCARRQSLGAQWRETFTTNGHYANYCVAMAVTDKTKGSHGISAFILEKGMKGFRPGKKENKLGMRASDTSEVIFNDCRVPQEICWAGRRRIYRQLEDSGWRKNFDRALALGMLRARSSGHKVREAAKTVWAGDQRVSAVQFKLATWPLKWRRRGCSFIRRRGWRIKRMCASRANRAWRNFLPAKSL